MCVSCISRDYFKLAVGTFSTAMSVGDFAVEWFANAKEAQVIFFILGRIRMKI